MEKRLRDQLDRRRKEGTLRSLLPLPGGSGDAAGSSNSPPRPASKPSIDFSSNDYLGLARCPSQLERVHGEYESFLRADGAASTPTSHSSSATPALGATGSRLLSGDSDLARSLEARLAAAHGRPAALICNSGYDANLSVLSSVPLPGDVVVMDELVHNSLVMGVRMSRIDERSTSLFRHNDIVDLERALRRAATAISDNKGGQGVRANSLVARRHVLVVVESVYSMDGDIAPLKDILDLSQQYGASVVVDEAHGLGIYGRTNRSDMLLPESQMDTRFGGDNASKNVRQNQEAKGGGTGVLAALGLESHPALLCSVHTFGKAAGCHGAVIAASSTVVDFLVNYARPFVYSTALPPHSLVAIKCAYEAMAGTEGEKRRSSVFRLVRLFRRSMIESLELADGSRISAVLLPSPSPIQAVLVPGNERCISLSNHLRSAGNFRLYPIRSPTVPKGEERIRIILHSHNTREEVLALVEMLASSVKAFGLLPEEVDRRSEISRL